MALAAYEVVEKLGVIFPDFRYTCTLIDDTSVASVEGFL